MAIKNLILLIFLTVCVFNLIPYGHRTEIKLFFHHILLVSTPLIIRHGPFFEENLQEFNVFLQQQHRRLCVIKAAILLNFHFLFFFYVETNICVEMVKEN